MNGKHPMGPDSDPNSDGLDPALAELFTAAEDNGPLADTGEFVRKVLRDMQRARRRRLVLQAGGTLIGLTAGAFVAPYVGEQTFAAVDWLSRNPEATQIPLVSPAACLLAILITWRIARRAFH
jgi:hypothetical protein